MRAACILLSALTALPQQPAAGPPKPQVVKEAKPQVVKEAKPQVVKEAKPQADGAKPQAQGAKPQAEEAKPQAEESKPHAEDAKPQAAAEAPPAPEGPFQGNLDFGYRFRSDVGGNFNAYRSVVNLGEGPKIFGLDFTFQPPGRKIADRIDVRANNWGGDPYNTARLDARKEGVYFLSVDYRNLAYFNFLPTFANPALDRGFLLNQRSFDIRRRLSDVELELRPGRWMTPYLAWTHDSGYGQGVSSFVSDGNEYPVATRIRDQTNHFRGGLRFELKRVHLTLEQGGALIKDDSRVYTSDRNLGNRTVPILGQQLFLTRLEQAYGVRGNSIYSKALLTASPASWMTMSGQFLYSRPSIDTNFQQSNTGNFVLLSEVLFYSGQRDLALAQAKLPHTSGSMAVEVRPFRRVRIVESWLTDRLHNTSSFRLTEQIQSPPLTLSSLATDRLVWNYNQQQVEVLLDVTSRLTLRGGHRYIWGNSEVRASLTSGLTGFEPAELKRHAGLAGINFRASQKLTVNADYEGASGDRTYFRTSLQDYRRLRARGRYQATGSLSVNASFSLLDNQNPAPTVDYDFQSRDSSLSFLWAPSQGKRVSLLADYSRFTVRSDIQYIVPQVFDRARSFYRDNGHTASALLDVAVGRARIGAGGSLFVSSGSRPTEYYQPLLRMVVPLYRHLEWRADWRYHGFGEVFYPMESFRAHLVTVGLRLIR